MFEIVSIILFETLTGGLRPILPLVTVVIESTPTTVNPVDMPSIGSAHRIYPGAIILTVDAKIPTIAINKPLAGVEGVDPHR